MSREINELHIPVGRPVRLTMTSEDVIHSFFVPAFRTKQDVVPGRYSTVWFQATKPGKYHLFCAEYCGTNHSAMIGWVYAMEPQDYENWLSGGTAQGTMTDNGKKLFESLACINCHKPDNTGRCPNLLGCSGARYTWRAAAPSRRTKPMSGNRSCFRKPRSSPATNR